MPLHHSYRSAVDDDDNVNEGATVTTRGQQSEHCNVKLLISALKLVPALINTVWFQLKA